LAVIIAASLFGTISSKLFSPGFDVMERVATLQQPYKAGKSRSSSGKPPIFVETIPWLGTGLGTYSLRYPPYRHPEDDNFALIAQ